MIKALHDRYDANNEEEDEKTNMIAFLPTMKLPVEVQPPDKMLCEHPFDAYILARGADARRTVQSFVLTVCGEHGGKRMARVGSRLETGLSPSTASVRMTWLRR